MENLLKKLLGRSGSSRAGGGVEPAGSEGGAAPAEPEGGAAPAKTEGGQVRAFLGKRAINGCKLRVRWCK